jgi:hypothetical protein
VLFEDLMQRGVHALRYVPLSFYANSVLVEVLLGKPFEPDAPSEQTLLLLVTEHGVMYLDGKSPRLHRHHATPGLLMLDTPQRAADYLRFFCGAVQGEEGPFSVVQDLNALNSRTAPGSRPFDAAELAELKVPDVLPRPVTPAEADGERPPRWRVDALVNYASALFVAQFAIYDSGLVEMIDDEPVWGDAGRLRQPYLRGGVLRGWKPAS